MKKVVLVMGFIIFGFCTNVIAQDKVVVIPLNSGPKVGGTDKQLQYNNNGTLSGAEVYYDDVNGRLGVGTATPSAQLSISGEDKRVIFSTSAYGDHQVDSSPMFIGRKARGTSLAPSAVNSGDVLTYLGSKGYDGVDWDFLSTGGISFVATEDHNALSKGTGMRFLTTSNGTTSKLTRMAISSEGGVGIGTVAPESGHRLHVNGLSRFDLNGGRIYISTPGDNPGLIAFEPATGHRRDVTFDAAGISLNVSNDSLAPSQDSGIRITENGDVGIGTSLPAGKLDVNGSIFQRGGSLHADYVFDPKYELESIEEHTAYMWEEKHLKSVPKAQVDENGLEILEMGAHRKGMLEELEKAHIYIGQLNEQIASLKSLVCSDHPEAKGCK